MGFTVRLASGIDLVYYEQDGEHVEWGVDSSGQLIVTEQHGSQTTTTTYNPVAWVSVRETEGDA